MLSSRPEATRPARWRRAIVVLGVSLALLTTALPSQAQTAPSHVLASVTITPTADGAIDVSWVSAGDPLHWKVIVVSDGVHLGRRTFPGSARSGRIDHMPPGTDVAVAVGGIDENGAFESFLSSSTVTMPRDPKCPKITNGTCVHLDGRTTTTPPSGVGLGVLHGITSSTDKAQLDRLDIRHWRLSAQDESRFRLAREAGGAITVVLSDPWMWSYQMGDGRAYSPWTNWDYYRWWVGTIVQWHIDRGLIPDRWEVQNEPLSAFFDAANPPTQDTIVEQHAIASEAVRALLPDAKIVGPSTYPFQQGHGVADMEAFAQKAAARGLDLDAVAWHEIVGACGDCDGGPSTVRQHIDDARAALSAAGLGTPPIDITEYGAPYEQLQPGAIVGYLDALIDGGVRYGGMSCWDRAGLSTGCFAPEGTLDGLLLPDGRATDAFWAYEAYAQLSSSGTLSRTTVDDLNTSAISSVSGTTVRALIGRHKGCTKADGPCPNGTTPGPTETINVRTTFPTTGKWKVSVTRLTSSSGYSAGPRSLLTKTITVSSANPVSLGSRSTSDGEVLQVVATRV